MPTLSHAECPRCGHHFASGGEVEDPVLGKKRDAELPQEDLDVYRGEGVHRGSSDRDQRPAGSDVADDQLSRRDGEIVARLALGGRVARRDGSDEDGRDAPAEYERERAVERRAEDRFNHREDSHADGARHFSGGGETRLSLAAHLAERERRPVLTGRFSDRAERPTMTRGGGSSGYPTDDQGEPPPWIAPYVKGRAARFARGGLAARLAQRAR